MTPDLSSFAAVIGAGEIGGAAAQAIASRECVREVRLIDSAAGVAAGKALDIMQAAPIEGYATSVTASGDLRAAAGAAAVVVADPFGSPAREWRGEEGLALLRRLWASAASDRSVIICAGSAHAPLIHAAVWELRIPRARIVGSPAAAFESAARALVAAALDGAGSDVSLMVLGAPPAAFVPCWSQADVSGTAITSRLSAAQIAALDARVPKLWPPAPYALGSAAAEAVEHVVNGSRRELTCFVALDGEMRLRRTVGALPVRLGPAGVVAIVEPELSPQERVRFENGSMTV